MKLVTRPARRSDAHSMCALLNAIIVTGGTTAHREPFTIDQMVSLYVEAPLSIACTVASEGSNLLGFQSVEWCDPNWTGEDALPDDWAVIATYVAQCAHGRGIGRLLFRETRQAAQAAGVTTIDATIRRENTGGLAYYSKMGFADYRESADAVSKRLDLL
ncbi:MAG: GNAT family N-acetyltransferase [Pseudomonadota bacterium]